MLKKFESLGTVLSRDEAKKIVGGLVIIDDGELRPCNAKPCVYFSDPTNPQSTTEGTCGSMGGIRNDCGCNGIVAMTECEMR